MRRLALVLVAAAVVVPNARADGFSNVSPPDGATLSSKDPVMFEWSSTWAVHPIFGGYVNLVVTSAAGTVFDTTYRCDPYPVQSCPSSATAGPFPPGTYSWYVRWWVWYEDRPAEWVSTTPTSFATGDPPPPPPPPPPTNQPPTARFSFTPTSPAPGDLVSFDGTASSDPDGSIVSYSWTFGNGNGAGGSPLVANRYEQAGMYTVTLVVEDNSGAKAETSATVVVLPPNQPPTARFSPSSASVTAGETVNFDGSASSDPDGSIVSYTWTFGDGNGATGPLVGHAYAQPGMYTATLVVVDDRGASAEASATVVVVPRPNAVPTARIAFLPAAPTAGEPIAFDASASNDPDGTIASYMWTFGDGETGAGASVQHAYVHAGTYTVELVVTDDRGATAHATATIVVAPRTPPTPAPATDTSAPQVEAIPSTGRAGSAVRMWFRSSDNSGVVRVTATVRRAGRTLATVS